MQESAEQRWTTVGVMQPYESLTRAVIPSPIRRAGGSVRAVDAAVGPNRTGARGEMSSIVFLQKSSRRSGHLARVNYHTRTQITCTSLCKWLYKLPSRNALRELGCSERHVNCRNSLCRSACAGEGNARLGSLRKPAKRAPQISRRMRVRDA
jgi:hypothetical protein